MLSFVSSGDGEHPAIIRFFESKVLSFSEAVVCHIPECVCEALDNIAYLHARDVHKKGRKKRWPPVRNTKGPAKKSQECDGDDGNNDTYASLAKLIARIAQLSKVQPQRHSRSNV